MEFTEFIMLNVIVLIGLDAFERGLHLFMEDSSISRLLTMMLKGNFNDQKHYGTEHFVPKITSLLPSY